MNVKCKIYKGDITFEDNGNVRFIDRSTKKTDHGYTDYYDEKEFKMHIQPLAKTLGLNVDAFDKDDNLFWSNYRDVKEVKQSDPDELEYLRLEYSELSGEEAKGNWGIPKLTKELEKLKQE